jgi:hypothetical protein
MIIAGRFRGRWRAPGRGTCCRLWTTTRRGDERNVALNPARQAGIEEGGEVNHDAGGGGTVLGQAGSLLAALAAILLEDSIGWRGMFFIGALPIITLLPLAFFRMPESVSWLVARGQIDKARGVSERTGVPMPEAARMRREQRRKPNIASDPGDLQRPGTGVDGDRARRSSR